MLLPMSWLREVVPGLDLDAGALAELLVRAGLKVERIHRWGAGVSGVVVAEVVEVEELTGFAKPVRYCQVAAGGSPRGVVCGATNFSVGDLVPLALPGAVLPGVGEISARTTYGRVSDGMLCSARELGLGEDHAGILVLGPGVTPGTDLAGLLADDVLEVEVTPDRGYCLSVRGLAREAAGVAGVPFVDPAAAVFGPQGSLPGPPQSRAEGAAEAGYPVVVEDTARCDRYVALTVTAVQPSAATPAELRLRLLRCGMRPLGLAVDVTNLVMLGLGQPLHAFDRDRLQGPLVVRGAEPGEPIRTLDGVDRRLDAEDLVIADDLGPVAIAGVMGGARAEVGPTTTSLVVESAHFDPVTVARSARRHRLVSQASRRFERGVDPALGPAAAWTAARLLASLGGATPGAATEVDHRRAPVAVALPPGEATRLAGRQVPLAAVRQRLEQVGCLVEPGAEGWLQVTPPPWRADLTEGADLVEEVLRLEGFDTIPSRLPRAVPGRGLTPAQRRRREVSRALAAEGLLEVVTPSFSAENPLGLPAGDPRRAAVRLANPLADDQAWLRTSLLPGLAAVVARNLGRGQGDVAVFETGHVVVGPLPPASPEPRPPAGRRPTAEQLAALDASLPRQPFHAAAMLVGDVEPVGWWGPGRRAGWDDALRCALAALRAAGAEPVVGPAAVAPWHPGRCAQLQVGAAVVGWAGELHPRTVEALGLPWGACAMELDLTDLLAAAPAAVQAPAISAFPSANVDVALLVATQVAQAEVAAALREGAGPTLEELRLFDRYQGPPVPPGEVSLAYTLVFRAPDRTLTGEEVNAARDAAVAAAARATGARLRS